MAVALTPPTLSSGSDSRLTCGYHTACTSPPSAGIALDWDDDNQSYGNDWRFRGFFYASDTVRTAFKMFPLVNQEGDEDCDIMTVWITETHSANLMATPLYMHTDITNSTAFSWTGGPWTVYHTRTIGTTIDDDGCTIFGSHVHEYHFPYQPDPDVDLIDITQHTSLYPDGDTCEIACGDFDNNDIANWTQRFAWDEGSFTH